MSNKVKDINIKKQTYYFFNDTIDIENFDLNNIEIGKNSYKNILFYYIGFTSIKQFVNMYSVDSLYLIFRYVIGYFKEINRNKYLTLVPTNGSIEKIKKHKEMWIKIRDLIISITENSDNYDEKYSKIKFNSDDKLPLNKAVEIPTIKIVVKAIFLENIKYYPQVFLDE